MNALQGYSGILDPNGGFLFDVALIFLVFVFVLWPNILTIGIGNKMNLAFFQNVKNNSSFF